MIEQYRPGLTFPAREVLARKTKVVLTEEFASRVNDQVGPLTDQYELATLFAPWDGYISFLATEEKRNYQPPPKSWVEFMKSISHQERGQLKRLIRSAYGFKECRTVGDIRDLTKRHHGGYYRIGERGIAFAALAFQKQEPAELTLGL
jgi:hypothetical protein